MKPQTSAFLGKNVGHIRVIDVLAEGGMGAVYVGFDDILQRKVALKAIRSEFRLSEDAPAVVALPRSRVPRRVRFANGPCTVGRSRGRLDGLQLITEVRIS